MSVGSVSSSTVSQVLQNSVSRLQAQLTTASKESSTCVLADIGLTLGDGAGPIVALHQQMADLAAISSSNATVTAQLDTASNALTGLRDLTGSMLSQIVQGASVSPASNGALGLQQSASGALASFVALSNAESGGAFVFGGINSGVAPLAAYAQTPASAAQTAAQNAFQTAFGFPVTSASVNTISASAMTAFLTGPFAALFSGSGWSSDWSQASGTASSNRIGVNQTATTSISANQPGFQDMAQGLTMIAEFGGLNLAPDAYAALIGAAQSVMNSANNGMIQSSSELGAMQNQLNQSNDAISLQQDVLTTRINSAEAVDGYEVSAKVSSLTTQLQTAYSLTAQIHKLSLVNFL